jgi:hypothetical protein
VFLQSLHPSVNSNMYFLPHPHLLATPAHLFIDKCVAEPDCQMVCTFELVCTETDVTDFVGRLAILTAGSDGFYRFLHATEAILY